MHCLRSFDVSNDGSKKLGGGGGAHFEVAVASFDGFFKKQNVDDFEFIWTVCVNVDSPQSFEFLSSQ